MKWLYCWKTKEGFENFISVDDDDYLYLKQFSTFTDQNGFAIIYNHITKRKERIHRVVTCARPTDWILFLDGNERNCTKENLIITRRESPNQSVQFCQLPTDQEKREAFAYRYWIAHQNIKKLSANKKPKKVYNSKGQIFNSVKEAASFYGIRSSGIYKCISGHAKTFHGIKWSFTKL